MDNAVLYVLTVLSLIIVILLLYLVKRSVSNANDGDASKAIRDEMSISRTESASLQRSQREELGNALTVMNNKINDIQSDNREFSQQLVQALDENFNKIRVSNLEQNSQQMKYVIDAMSTIQESNEKKLEQMRQTVDEKLSTTLNARLSTSFKTVSEQLEKVYVSLGEMKNLSTGVTENVTSLNRILTNVKSRGTWAEVQLESILLQTVPGMFEKNVHTVSDSREVVEFAVKIPAGDGEKGYSYLPVDSKFPLEDYARLCVAAEKGDADTVAECRKALERRVITFARDITKYINEPQTTPFAIMYLATEGLYSEIINSENAVAERIQSEYSVMIAGPSTVTALLNSLAMGMRAFAVNEKAKEVRSMLAAARMQYDKFGEVLEKARRKIDEAGKSLDEAQSRNEIIKKKLKSAGDTDSEEYN